MRIPLAPALAVSTLSLLAVVWPAPSSADTVYLTNGKSFEGVVAQVGDSQVRIQMPGGEIRVPKASVERVEQADSPFAEYLQRKAALARAGHAGDAADWLALARWASARGLDQGAREAALRAAQLDPHLDGLAPILRGYGYVHDRELDRYIPYADSMHRRGLVNEGGRWISREEQQAEQSEMRRAREENRERQAALQAVEAARAASEAQRELAELQVYQQQAAAGESAGYPGYLDGYSPYGFTLGVFPGFFPPALSFRHGRGHGFPGAHGSHGHGQGFGMSGGRGAGGYGSLIGRVPGSLLPPSPPARRR